MNPTEKQPDYTEWSTDELIKRVNLLEHQLKDQVAKNKSGLSPRSPPPATRPRNARVNREFDPSKYSTRLIALKFAYLGQRYNGLEFHTNNKTPLPTVEEELWKALSKARLVFPTPNPDLEPGEPNWEGCEYSKCGRTDKGVSAFGQVVGIRVRSNRPVCRGQSRAPAENSDVDGEDGRQQHPVEMAVDAAALNAGMGDESRMSTPESAVTLPDDKASVFDPISDEIQYCQILNRLLPPDIRMLAWCPAPPSDFSARFSCRERRYKYFFTQPAFTPTIGAKGLLDEIKPSTPVAGRRREGWLDIDAMQEAAHKFVGLHDFRNFCKVDPSKQIETFERRIFHADIEELNPLHEPVGYVGYPGFQQYDDMSPGSRLPPSINNGEPLAPKIYTFALHGSAFLWHQVRHMVGILFLIGQGLESPSLIEKLLDVQSIPGKPQYEMADDAPLVLWDCVFPKEGSTNRSDALKWLYIGESTEMQNNVRESADGSSEGRYGLGGVVDEMWKVWRGRKIDEMLAGMLLDVIVDQGHRNFLDPNSGPKLSRKNKHDRSQKVFQGGDGPRFVGKYVPVLQKPRMESVEDINAKYAKRKALEA